MNRSEYAAYVSLREAAQFQRERAERDARTLAAATAARRALYRKRMRDRALIRASVAATVAGLFILQFIR